MVNIKLKLCISVHDCETCSPDWRCYNCPSLWEPLNWRELSGRRQWHPTPVLLPGKPHGWRSLVGCSPWGCEEWNTTEWLHFSLSCIREGDGNPLQCSCLENPRDGGAWWAAISGVAQSQTRLKQLSSSSSSMVGSTYALGYNLISYVLCGCTALLSHQLCVQITKWEDKGNNICNWMSFSIAFK